MKRDLKFRRTKTKVTIEKELFSPLFKRESSCSYGFVASLNHSIVLGRKFLWDTHFIKAIITVNSLINVSKFGKAMEITP